MKIVCIGAPKIIIENPLSKHRYFGWPTAARLQNGTIAVVASGFRLRHVCPFGKTVISYSNDDGETYTPPAPVIDTVLDDRDGGIVPFGEKNVIVTSFNNTVAFQRNLPDSTPYDLAYLDTITTKEEKAAIGSNFRISTDCGITFGKIFKSPVTSPHGPVELPDGTLLWVGRTFSAENTQMQSDCIQAHKINKDGTTAYVGAIENVTVDSCHVLSCEPHAIVLDDGSLLAHIRVQNYEHNIFTIFQSESKDNGKTWTKPKQVLSKAGGAPPHLFKHPSGLLICTYGFRGTRYGVGPFGVKAMFSSDNGKTWETDFDIYKNNESEDLGYPSTVSLSDGSLLTIFYARPQKNQPAVIMQQKWRVEL